MHRERLDGRAGYDHGLDLAFGEALEQRTREAEQLAAVHLHVGAGVGA